MHRSLITPLFTALLICLTAIYALNQFTHVEFGNENKWTVDTIEFLLATAGLAAFFMLLQTVRKNEKKLRQSNQELIKLSEERTQVMKELDEHRASLAKAQRISRLGNWDWDIQTGELKWSDEIYRIFGFSPQQFTASYETFLKAIHIDDRDLVKEALNRAIFYKEPYIIDHRVVRPDGTIRCVHSQGEVEFNNSSTPLTMSGTVLDITERKHRENEIRQLNEDLESRVEERTAKLVQEISVREAAEKERLRESKKAEHYLAMAGNMLVALNPQGQIDMINAKGAEILGYDDPQDLIGRNWFQTAIPEHNRTRVENVFLEIMSGQQLDSFKEYENEIITKSGDRCMMQWHNTILYDTDGNVSGALGAATDITAQKQYEEVLLRAKNAAEEANQTKSGFLSNMSHELRTPMNAILGFGQLIQSMGDNLNETQLEYIDIILRSGDHLLNLINEILDLSRIEIGALRVELGDVPTLDAINGATTLLSPMAAKHNVTIHIADDFRTSSMMTADPQRLHQVLVNLISNAIKYNRDNGEIHISTSTIPDKNMVRITIRDTGCGIPTHRQHELFQPFNRLSAENSGIEGTGVGLVLTRNLIDLMNGSLGYDSVEDQGSTFWIELPAVVDQDVTPSAPATPTSPKATGDPRHILCIEGNLIDQRLLHDIVTQLDDVEYISVLDITQAIETAKTQRPNLVVLNVERPCEEDEVKLQKWCREQSEPIPILAICASQGVRDPKTCDIQDYAVCLDKPIDMDKLLDALNGALNPEPHEANEKYQDYEASDDNKIIQLATVRNNI